MTTLATLTVAVESDITKLDSGLSSAGSKLKSFGSKLTSAGTSLTKGLTLPIVAFGGAAVAAFVEADKVAAQTAAVIESTGGAAHVTAGQVGKLATQISMYSGISDEAIAAGENMLLTFTNIQNRAGEGNDIFTQATKLLTDLSVALGTDASSSAIQLGKALQDPVKGVTALSRVGVIFTEGQKKMIEQMVKAGDVAGAQRVILDELAKEFGGSARAMGETAAGQFGIAKEKIGNAMEGIGQVILEIGVPIFEKLSSVLQSVLGWFNNLSPSTKELIVTIAGIAAVVGPALIVFGKLVSGIGAVMNAFKALGAVLSANPYVLIIAATIAIVALIVANWGKIKDFLIAAWEKIKSIAIAVWDGIKGFFKRWWPLLLGIMTGGIGLVVVLIVKNWNEIKDFVVKVWDGIKGAIGAAIDWVKDKIGDVIRGIQGTWENVWGAVKRFFSGIWDGIVKIAKNAMNLVIGFVNTIIDGLNKLVNGIDVALGPFINFPDIPHIPSLARGGIVTRPTLAAIAERGPEAVVPLHRGLAGLSAGGPPVIINVQGSVIAERDLAVTVRDELIRLRKRNVTTGIE